MQLSQRSRKLLVESDNSHVMRILFAITVFPPSRIFGGPATVALNQARELVKRGHEVTVATSDVLTMHPRQHLTTQETEMDGVHVRYFPTWIVIPRFPALISFKLWKWLKQSIKDYDVVHVHFARDWIPVAVAREAIRQGVRVFLQPHGMLGRTDGIRKTLDRLLIGRVLERVTGVLPLQETEQRNIATISPNAKTIIVPNGVTIQSESMLWNADALRKRTVLFLARLHPRKRVMSVIEAAKLLMESGHRIRFRIVGPDEGDLSRAQQRVMEYGLETLVEFVGPLAHERVAEEFVNASLYVLPSVDEPFPMTVLEALALGVPTIVTEGIHIRALLERHQASMVVQPTAQSIAAGIAELFAKPDLATLLSENGKRLMANELTIDKVVTHLESVYQGAHPDVSPAFAHTVIG
jgi:glycosyltransferase involved in cell wall biosynthesis